MDSEKDTESALGGGTWSFDPADYRDLNVMIETGRRLGRHISQRLDNLMGIIEWLKTDCLKKGSRKHAEQMALLSDRVEKTSEIMESMSNGEGAGRDPEGPHEKISRRCLEQDRALYALLLEIEGCVQRMTEAGKIPEEQDIHEIQTALGRAERMTADREALLKMV